MRLLLALIAAATTGAAASAQDWGNWYADEYANPITDTYTANLYIRQQGGNGASLEWMCSPTRVAESGETEFEVGMLISEGITQRERPNQTPIHYRVDSGEARTIYADRSLNGQYLIVRPQRAMQVFREMQAATSQIVFTINHIDYYTLHVNSLGEAAQNFSYRCPPLTPVLVP